MPVDLEALTRRADLLASEAGIVSSAKMTWAGRLRSLGTDYGRSGGSAADRRAVIEAMVAIERGDVTLHSLEKTPCQVCDPAGTHGAWMDRHPGERCGECGRISGASTPEGG